jgi:VIT1/CCC1 family predicted Fe2+/Mn2+ transporter
MPEDLRRRGRTQPPGNDNVRTNAPNRRRRGRHRDVQGSGARAAVLGAGDGLLTNVSLVLGVAGAHVPAATVRLAGIAGLLAGAFSMAAGELVSVRAAEELVAREVAVERDEIEDDPRGEERELQRMYERRGLSGAKAARVAAILMSDPDIALDAHVGLELGVEPHQRGSARQAAMASFVSFAAGAIIPLLPWFLTSGVAAIAASIVLGAGAALALGAAIGAVTGAGRARTALRQLTAAVIAASVTYGIGSLFGVRAS